MKTKEIMILAGAAGLAWVLMQRQQGKSVLGWWYGLAGVKPGSQQAAMLAEQEAAFYEAVNGNYQAAPHRAYI